MKACEGRAGMRGQSTLTQMMPEDISQGQWASPTPQAHFAASLAFSYVKHFHAKLELSTSSFQLLMACVL